MYYFRGAVLQQINGTVKGFITRKSKCLTQDLVIFRVTARNLCELFSGLVRVLNNKLTRDVTLLSPAIVSIQMEIIS